MPELVADCPRCGTTKITFDVLSAYLTGEKYNWQAWYDAFVVCRHCSRTVVFVLSQSTGETTQLIRKVGLLGLEGSVNQFFHIEGFVCIKDFSRVNPPDYLPENIKSAFDEGAACMAINCFNAGATMFRLCIDHSTKALLPSQDTQGLNRQTRRSLGLRLKWLFDNKLLPESLKELSACIKEDGNDGAHEGTLTKEDAEDLLDFTTVLLERLYTEPERLKLAEQRRAARRSSSS